MRSIIVICFCFLVNYSMGQDSLHVQRPNVCFYDDPNPFLKNHAEIDDFQEVVIYNRWGEQMFESSDPKFIWNGRNQKTDELLQTGFYIFDIKTREKTWRINVYLMGHYCPG